MAKIAFRFLASLTPNNRGETIREAGKLRGRVQPLFIGFLSIRIFLTRVARACERRDNRFNMKSDARTMFFALEGGRMIQNNPA
jgi:hypothetical protein